ncbi:AAA family ATPase [Egicoccus sp. AB-alg2]|uniref:ATP-binding protein n=1 Tax=Egicoccus sp. AB-alg2 TaxID=3242693 RepID=UPI00359EEC60
MRLLERDAELQLLDRAVSAAAAGAGSVVLVAGEPGIGKSALVDAWLARLPDTVRILRGACDDLVTPRLLGPFRDMVRGTQAPLAGALESAGSRDGVLGAIQAELSSPLRTTVAVIEDLHWADEATLDAVRFLARRIADEPTVLVTTYRDDLPADHPLLAATGALTGPAVHRLALAGLSVAGVATLGAEAGLSAAQVHDITGGNPFFVTEVLSSPGREVPTTVREAVGARLRELPDTARRALEQLAVAPGGLSLALVERVVAGGMAALEEPERRRFTAFVDGTARFRHELIRRAVVASCTAAQLAVAHARVLAALDPDRTDPARLVHHAVGAGDAEAVARHAPAAARAAAQAGAHRDSVGLYEHVLRFPELLPAAERAAVRTDHARELLLVNRLEEGLAEAERAVAESERLGDPEGLGIALTVLADARYWGLRGATAAAAAEQAVAVLRSLPPDRPLARATSTLAFVQVMDNRFADAERSADEAVVLADAVGAPDLRSHALAQRGLARVMLDDERGLEDLRGALRSALELPHHEHVVVASVGLASAMHRAGRTADAEEVLATGLAHAQRHDLTTAATTLRMMRSGLDLARGDWREAEQGLRAALGEGQGTGWGETVAAALLGRLRARQQAGGAEELLDRAWQLATASGEIQRIGPAGAAWLEWGWLTGQLDRVRDRVEYATATARRVGHRWYLGELLRYRMLAEGPAEVTDALPEPWASGCRGAWREAAATWQERGAPYERALELYASAEVAAVLEALTEFDRLGALATATLARRRLKELGVRHIPRGPRAETRDHPLGLTPRQVEVLGLLVTGATNPEIAERLVLSVRTVDHHVSAVLTKLGVGSRREVAARAEELGLLPATVR